MFLMNSTTYEIETSKPDNFEDCSGLANGCWDDGSLDFFCYQLVMMVIISASDIRE